MQLLKVSIVLLFFTTTVMSQLITLAPPSLNVEMIYSNYFEITGIELQELIITLLHLMYICKETL